MADLTTVAAVEAWLRLPSGNADEGVLSTLITAASTFVESETGRQFVSQAYTETRDGTGGARLSFANKPVTAVSAVMIDNVTVPAQPGFGQPGYTFSATALTLHGYRFRRGLGNVALAYTAGYTTIPADLAQTVVEMVGLRYREMDRIGKTSEAVAGETTAFKWADLSAFGASTVERYKKVTPV